MKVSAEQGLRLFVACELPTEATDALAQIQETLRSRVPSRLRWVRPEGIHLTLKFLGSVPASRVREIEERLAGAIDEAFALSLRIGPLGSFGGRQRLRVIWVGLEGDVEELAAIADKVEDALTPLGFPRENRRFAPHLTLARVPDEVPPSERERTADLLPTVEPPARPSFTVAGVSLMQSFLQPSGARYERLASFPE